MQSCICIFERLLNIVTTLSPSVHIMNMSTCTWNMSEKWKIDFDNFLRGLHYDEYVEDDEGWYINRKLINDDDVVYRLYYLYEEHKSRVSKLWCYWICFIYCPPFIHPSHQHSPPYETFVLKIRITRSFESSEGFLCFVFSKTSLKYFRSYVSQALPNEPNRNVTVSYVAAIELWYSPIR